MTSQLASVLSGRLKPGLYRLVSRITTDALCRQIELAGWRCVRIDGAAIGNKAALLSAFSTALRFPAYFGGNWDAFEECLHDLPVDADAKGLLILIEHAERFSKAQPKEWGTACDIFATVIASRHEEGAALAVLLRGLGAGNGIRTLSAG